MKDYEASRHYEPGEGVVPSDGTKPLSKLTVWLLEFKVGDVKIAPREVNYNTLRWCCSNNKRRNRYFRVNKIADGVYQVARLA